MPKIQVRINKKTGVMKIEAQGFSGDACLEATKKLREGLGITDEPERTAEYYATEEQSEQQQQGG